MKASDFTIQKSGIFFLIYMLILVLGNVVLMPFNNSISQNAMTVLSVTVPYIIIGIVINIYMIRYHFSYKAADIEPTLMQVFFMCPLLIFVYPMMMFVTTLSSAAFAWMGTDISTAFVNNMSHTLSLLGPFGSVIVFAVLPAYVEEFAFRGIMYGAFRKYGFVWAMLVSSISFAMMHMSVDQFFYTLLMGMFLALIREITGSTYPCLILHAGFNGLSVLAYFMSDSIKLMEQSSVQRSVWMDVLELGVISLVASVVVMFLIKKLIKLSKYKFKKESVKLEIPVLYIIIWVVCGCFAVLSI